MVVVVGEVIIGEVVGETARRPQGDRKRPEAPARRLGPEEAPISIQWSFALLKRQIGDVPRPEPIALAADELS